MKIENYFLFGASGHGKVIAEILEAAGCSILGFLDEDHQKKTILNYTVYHHLSEIPPDASAKWVISIGNNQTRKQQAELLLFSYGTAIHPSAQISKRSLTGEGTAVMSGVCINSETKVGRHCILNTGCSVDHDCYIEDYVHISPGARIAGGVTVGEGTHIGIGASVIQGIKIGKWSTIGAGAAIIENVPDYCTVAGVPGCIIKTNQ